MFKKLIYFVFLSILLSFLALLNPIEARAENEFITDVVVTYSLASNGNTTITNEITLENVFSEFYAKSYNLSIQNSKVVNPKAFQSRQSLPLEVAVEGEKTKLTVSFPDDLVGRGKTRKFSISYEGDGTAIKTGEVWEISIPKVTNIDQFRSYSLNLVVSKGLGKEAYISPNPSTKSFDISNYYYSFSKETLGQSALVAGFGDFQVFSFTLNYHLENPLSNTAETQIALPPDTSLQKIYYTSIFPIPENITIDEEGNWLGKYILSPRARIDVVAKGSVQIFSNHRTIDISEDNVYKNNLSPSTYWQINDPKITKLAEDLRTPKNIYDYVSSTLVYDYERVRPNVSRLGASTVLETPKSAICTEYTDLTVALLRAAGIPAREVNGFAYTENPSIQPLGLVADVLHAWPEYWDSQKKIWVPIDPTWGSTTGGEDFFNKLDLRHFSFVMHGIDPLKPYPPGSYKLGPNPQKDVYVSFGSLPEKRSEDISIEAKYIKGLPFFGDEVAVSVKNSGTVAAYEVLQSIYFDDLKHLERSTDVLPFTSDKYSIKVPFSFLGRSTPESVIIQIGSKKVSVPTNKTEIIIYNLLGLFLIFGLIIVTILAIIKKNLLIQIFNKTKEKFSKKKLEPSQENENTGTKEITEPKK